MLQDVAGSCGGQLAGRVAVDHENRRQATATQASHFIEGEPALGIGVGPVGDRQIAAQFVCDLPCAGDVTGGAMADAHHVLTNGRAPEPGIKRRCARDLGGRDFREFAYAEESFIGQIAVVGLDGLEEQDRRLSPAAEPRNRLVHKGEV